MRHSSGGKRPRGRSGRRSGGGGGGGGSGPNSNRAYDSNGPSGKLRGTASQLVDKYTAMARDARAGRDRVLVENYFQHAEHYQRIVNEVQAQQAAREEQPQVQQNQPPGDQQQSPATQQPEVKKPEQQEAAKVDKQPEPPAQPAPAVKESKEAKGSKDVKQLDSSAVNGAPGSEEQPIVEVPVTEEAEVAVEAKPKRRRRAPAKKKVEAEAPDTVEEAPSADA